MKKTYLLLYSLLISSISSPAQNTLQHAIQQLAQDKTLQHGSLSACIIDVESAQIIASHQPLKTLRPASSLKVLTTATALAILGENYRFTTQLKYTGTIHPTGTLQGNLYLTGTGDPTLGSSRWNGTASLEEVMEQCYQALAAKGIKNMEGNIIADASYFETAAAGRHWLWEDLGNYYAAGVWGINIHDNLYYLHFTQNPQVGQPTTIDTIEPAIPGLSFINEVHSGPINSGDNAYIFGSPYTFNRYVRGTIPPGKGRFTIKGAIPHPPLFAVQYLTQYLSKKGIPTTNPPQATFQAPNETTQTIHTHHSPPLRDIVTQANHKSINTYCESLLKAIGQHTQSQGTTQAGLSAILNYWSARGWKAQGIHIHDGSGLSPLNAISSQHLASLLQLIAQDKSLYSSFFDSLPVAAKSGTLKNLFKNTIAANNLRAKSGSMLHTYSYTGYACNPSGQLRSFSIIANNFSGTHRSMRKKMEKLMLAICQSTN